MFVSVKSVDKHEPTDTVACVCSMLEAYIDCSVHLFSNNLRCHSIKEVGFRELKIDLLSKLFPSKDVASRRIRWKLIWYSLTLLVPRSGVWFYLLGGGHLQPCGSFKLSKCRHVWIIPSFRIWVMCCMHHELWPTSVSHFFFSFTNSCLVLAGGKTSPENYYPIIKLALQFVSVPCCFPYILYYLIIYGYFPLAGLCLQYMALLQSREQVKWL